MVQKTHFPFIQSNSNTVNQQKVVSKAFIFEGYSDTLREHAIKIINFERKNRINRMTRQKSAIFANEKLYKYTIDKNYRKFKDH